MHLSRRARRRPLEDVHTSTPHQGCRCVPVLGVEFAEQRWKSHVARSGGGRAASSEPVDRCRRVRGAGLTGEVLTVARMSDDEVVPADVLGRFDEAGLIELNELAYVAGVVARQTF